VGYDGGTPVVWVSCDISRRDASIPVVVTYPIESRRSCSTYRFESSLVWSLDVASHARSIRTDMSFPITPLLHDRSDRYISVHADMSFPALSLRTTYRVAPGRFM
jgi:hypothetical protein